MVIKEIKEINGVQYVYHYSSEGLYIERDGVMYSEAIDPLGSEKQYTETTELIESNLEKRIIKLEETNKTQDELINTTMLATDEMFTMLEPLLSEVATVSTLSLERSVRNPMVDMYVAMVMRGLKTVEQVPARYREEVREILAQLEK